MKHVAHKNARLGGYDYRGFYIEKPEGSDYWNIREVDQKGVVDWCHVYANGDTLKEAKATVDYIIDSLNYWMYA